MKNIVLINGNEIRLNSLMDEVSFGKTNYDSIITGTTASLIFSITINSPHLLKKERNPSLSTYILTLIISFVGATPVPKKLVNKVRSAKKGNIVINILEPFVLFTILILVTAYLVDGSFNPFLYFRF